MILNPNQKISDIPSRLEGAIESSQLLVSGFSGGVYEVQTAVAAAFASTAQADYFVLEDTAGQAFAVWLDKDANGTAPTGAAYVASDFQIEVDIVTGDTAAQVAGKIKTAMEADVNFEDITISINSATLTFTQDLVGNVTAPARHNADDSGNGSFVVATVTGGALPDLNSKYFQFSKSGTNYYAWFNVNAQGVDPAPGGTGVEVVLTGNESASGIATAAASAIDALAGITSSADGARIIIGVDAEGDILNGSDGDSGLTFSVNSQGSSTVFEPSTLVGDLNMNPSVISAAT